MKTLKLHCQLLYSILLFAMLATHGSCMSDEAGSRVASSTIECEPADSHHLSDSKAQMAVPRSRGLRMTRNLDLHKVKTVQLAGDSLELNGSGPVYGQACGSSLVLYVASKRLVVVLKMPSLAVASTHRVDKFGGLDAYGTSPISINESSGDIAYTLIAPSRVISRCYLFNSANSVHHEIAGRPIDRGLGSILMENGSVWIHDAGSFRAGTDTFALSIPNSYGNISSHLMRFVSLSHDRAGLLLAGGRNVKPAIVVVDHSGVVRDCIIVPRWTTQLSSSGSRILMPMSDGRAIMYDDQDQSVTLLHFAEPICSNWTFRTIGYCNEENLYFCWCFDSCTVTMWCGHRNEQVEPVGVTGNQ